jgi:hypothetical protein
MGTSSRIAMMAGLLGLALVAGACASSGESAATVGSEGEACTPGGSCDPGLTCLSKRCVRETNTGMTGGPMGSGGTPGGSGGGSGGSPPVDPTTDFTGSWKYTTGTSTAQCTGNNETKQLVGTFFKLKRGTDSSLIFLIENPTCSLKMDLNGNTASFRSGTSCSYAQGGASFKLELGDGGSIVTTGPNNASVGFAGTITATGGSTIVCTYTINGMATRFSPE